MNGSEEFFLTRVASSTSGRAKSKFLSVTKDLEPFGIYQGNPAGLVRQHVVEAQSAI
jgi:hypothetical protein